MSNRGQTYRDLNAAIVKIGAVPCHDIPDIFYPEDFPDKQTREYAIRTAKALCKECPLLIQCFAYAIEAQEPYGIWAGTLPHER